MVSNSCGIEFSFRNGQSKLLRPLADKMTSLVICKFAAPVSLINEYEEEV